MLSTEDNRESNLNDKPRLILIVGDDLGFSNIGCIGSEIQPSNPDWLGFGGVRFSQLSNRTRCCPIRASILTGLSPNQAGIDSLSLTS